jgi:hydroxymethylbilane synthase
MRDLVLGSRGSQLALWQSEHIRALLLRSNPGLGIRIEVIKTLGDKILDSPLSRMGDKGLFTKEIEKALTERTIDLAVHSLKDLPTVLPTGLVIGAITLRDDPRDVFIAHPARSVPSFSDVPSGSTIATGSLRRMSQLLASRPDLHIADIRGNLNTRMKKLEDSNWAGMLLANAGVKRLGWEDRITEVLPTSIMLPAVGQGALAVEIREEDSDISNLLQTVHDRATELAVRAERAFLRRLEGGCQVPIGTHARFSGETLSLDAFIGSLDGKRALRDTRSAASDDPEALGSGLADHMFRMGGDEILAEIRAAGSKTT